MRERHARTDYQRVTNNELIAERAAERVEARMRPIMEALALEVASSRIEIRSLKREVRRLRRSR